MAYPKHIEDFYTDSLEILSATNPNTVLFNPKIIRWLQRELLDVYSKGYDDSIIVNGGIKNK